MARVHLRFSPRPNSSNLVQWRAWGQDAFDEAAGSDKLIALFVVAFWCGVCQRLDETALSSEEVQLLLNAYFVPIRVEESVRPDVDLRYAPDGWPTIVFMTPRAEPIVTVNALETEQLISLLVQLVDAHDKRLIESRSSEAAPSHEPAARALNKSTVQEIVQLLDELADHRHGGFGGPHKYFYPDALRFYLHLGRVDHVEFTLSTLVDRQIYDGADGSFFRYSSKPDWNEPHREKLLIDQADLLRAYLETFQHTYDVAHQRTAERLIDYLEHTLRVPNSPFLAGCQDYIRNPEDNAWSPIIDSLVYCDANAHAVMAYLHAWNTLGRADCLQRGVELLDALWNTFKLESGGVQHCFDGADAHVPGLLNDAVALGWALLDGYSATGDQRYFEQARQLANDIVGLHKNPDGGFFDISQPGPAALRRPVTDLTQNAAAALFFLRFAEMRDAAQWALLGYSGSARVYGAYAASFGHALDVYLATVT